MKSDIDNFFRENIATGSVVKVTSYVLVRKSDYHFIIIGIFINIFIIIVLVTLVFKGKK